MKQQSPQWEFNNKKYLNKVSLSNFKSSAVNNKLALCDPDNHGLRYLKTLLYSLCYHLEPDRLAILKRVKNRHVGKPYTVKWEGQEVDLDYYQAVLEYSFLVHFIDLIGLSILELGSGYGRTCHTIISNANVKEYILVDLKPALSLAKKYLKKVLTKRQFKKIRFIEAGQDLPESVDLVINIDSISEMTEDVVRYYLDYIDKHSKYFYTKNPVGKYYDKALDNHHGGKGIVNIALKMGIIHDVIDLFDNRAVEKQSKKYIKAYKPGRKWKVLAEEPAPFWSHYWNCLYVKS